MISAVLRVHATDFEPKAFIKEFCIDPDAVFESGFNMCLADTPKKDQFLEEFSEALHNSRDIFKELSKRGIEAKIDIGVTVGTEEQYACSIALSVEVMKLLTAHGIQLVFSAYPACDDT